MYEHRALLALLILIILASVGDASYNNVAYNRTPTINASNWTTSPTNLGNAVDSNMSTSTGAGRFDNSITDDTTYYFIDLGANYNLAKLYVYGVLTFQGTIVPVPYTSLKISSDNISWTTVRTFTRTPNWLVYDYNYGVFGVNNVRYIKYSVYSNIVTDLSNSYVAEMWANTSFNLSLPTNSSVLYKDYPPLTDDINFSWDSDITTAQLLVAKDSNFNLITVDTVVASSYSVQSLEAGNYWWKVRPYNSVLGTYGNYSDTFNFTLSNTQSTSGTAIQGVVSELVNGVATPLDGVTVYIQSSAANWSNSMITGTNGYYLFDGLSNTTTYYVYASKTEYVTSTAEYVTTGAGTWTTKNIQLKKTEPTDFESDKQYVKFRARWLWCISDCDISGATISAYKSGDVIAYASGVTDSTGSIKLRLYKEQLYRVTVVNATAGISQEMTIYPADTEYMFLITNTEPTWQTYPVQEKDAITIGVSKSTINTTHATIAVNYTDSLSGTTALTYYINQSNNTVVTSWTWASGTFNHTFSISGYSGQSYTVHVVATQSTYGTIDRSYAIVFEKSSIGISGISSTLSLWFAIGIMFFTAAIFTSSTAEKGLMIVCAEGWIFFILGFFTSLNSVQFAIGLTLASVIAVFAHIKSSQAREGFA